LEISIAIFYDRINGRFLAPISKIEKYNFSGFVVMALDCLLIETLQQFVEGKAKTPNNGGKEYFQKYLTKYIGEPFDNQMAGMFFKQIRCGLLHQAEVHKNSLIRRTEDLPITKYTEKKTGLITNRIKFHERLKDAIEHYIEELRDPQNKELRNNFRKKMDYICRVSSNVN
jgi:hypothetical protein